MDTNAHTHTHTHTYISYHIISGGTYGVMVIVVGNGHVTRVQILDEAVDISHNANTVGKGMCTTTLPPAMGKL